MTEGICAVSGCGNSAKAGLRSVCESCYTYGTKKAGSGKREAVLRALGVGFRDTPRTGKRAEMLYRRGWRPAPAPTREPLEADECSSSETE